MTTTTAHRSARTSRPRLSVRGVLDFLAARRRAPPHADAAQRCSTTTCCATWASPAPTVDAEVRRTFDRVTRSAERIARQLLVGWRPRRRDASGRGENPRPRSAAPHRRRAATTACSSRAAVREALGQPRQRDVRHEAPPGKRDAGAARGGLDLGLQVAERRGCAARRHRPPAAGRRRRGRRPASASSKPGAATARKATSTSSSWRSGISPRKTSVRCRLSGGTVRGTGRPCCSSIRSKRTGSGSASAAKARIIGRRITGGARRSTSSSTGGPMPSTMAATPSAFGCRPSGWKSAHDLAHAPPLGHAAEERAHVDRVVLAGEVAEGGPERLAVVGRVVGRRRQAGKQHRQARARRSRSGCRRGFAASRRRRGRAACRWRRARR